MQSQAARAIFLGVAIFLGLLIAKFISKEPFTLISLAGPAVGGIVAALVVYFLGGRLGRKKE